MPCLNFLEQSGRDDVCDTMSHIPGIVHPQYKVDVIHNQLTSHDLQKRKVGSDFALIRHFKHNYDLYSKSGSDKTQRIVSYILQ